MYMPSTVSRRKPLIASRALRDSTWSLSALQYPVAAKNERERDPDPPLAGCHIRVTQAQVRLGSEVI